MRKLAILLLVALGVLLVTPAVASASTPSLKSLSKTVKALQKSEKSQAAAIKSLQSKVTTLQGTVSSQAGTIATLQSVVGADSAHGLRKSVATIAANPVLTLSWLPTYLSLDKNAENGVIGPNIVFQGANVHMRSSSSDGDGTGTGNLIVGWDDAPSSIPTVYRIGDNNLVCGDGNNFTSYGDFVAGYSNTVSAPCASVSGGWANTASNGYASVSGGDNNRATGYTASISGGESNKAEGGGDSVSGAAHVTDDVTDGWSVGKYTAP